MIKKTFYLLLLLIVGCQPETIDSEEQVFDNNPEYSVFNGDLVQIEYGGNQLLVQETDTAYVLEGDILIPKDFKDFNKAAAINKERWWPNNTVYYSIDSNLSNNTKVEIKDAIAHWENLTNLVFLPRTSQQAYVYFTTGSGCSSYVGMTGGAQAIRLSEACSTGNIVHEIGHAVGLWHEQSRADRDQYIIVHEDNIASGAEHNFSKYYNGVDLTPDLDFGSIMMYSPYAFTNNGYPTITKLDGSTYRVQRSSLSEGDLYGINKMYPDDTVIIIDLDTDGDGIIDKEDLCPDEAGDKLNRGCPWINGETYKVHGVWVKRNYDSWWYWSRLYGQWKEVYLRGGYWYYVK